MLYPLFFDSVYKERVWGGNQLQNLYQRSVPYKHTGESWDIACHPNGVSKIVHGPLKGMTLQELFEKDPKALLGQELGHLKKFPLLIKLLDAQDKLSVQVHPQDEYAKIHEQGELGKCEMWYVLSAPQKATLVAGLKEGTTKEKFEKAIQQGKVESYLTRIPVQAGDIINIPAGLVHAIEENIVIAEIQQNSDTVYRVYDWNRVGLDGQPRELHVKKALDVIDFTPQSNPKIDGLMIEQSDATYTYYIANSYFAIEKIQLHGTIEENTKNLKFYLYTCVNGEGIIEHNEIQSKFKKGQSFMIPGDIGKYHITGKAVLLKSYVPDIPKDFIQPLLENGYTNEDIQKHVAIE